MPRIDTPIVLVTRPAADAKRFVEGLRVIAGPFEAIISPAFEIEAIEVDIPSFDVAVFTSRMGVAHAPSGNGREAFCVGEATATAARRVGYIPISADGSADDLVALILNKKPTGSLLHIRGEISRGDVMSRLKGSGVNCLEAIVYRKVSKGPTVALKDALNERKKIIITLFSAETVSIMREWTLSFKDPQIVAISDEVARSVTFLKPSSIVVSDAPNMGGMVRAVARLIA